MRLTEWVAKGKVEMSTDLHGFQVHPVAAAYPLIDGDEFQQLVASVKANGLRDPIVLSSEQIIDGRNRLRACISAGVKPEFTRYGGADVESYIIDKNERRRHLSESQRAMVAAAIANLTRRDNQHAQICASSTSIKDAAQKLRVGKRSVTSAKKVRAKGVPELIAAVTNGEIAVSTAADIADLPTAQQHAAIETRNGNKMTQPELVAQKKRVLELHASGMRISDIASAVGRPRETIANWIESPESAPKQKGGGPARKVEDSEVERLFNAGRSRAEIAAELGIKLGTVGNYLSRLGLSRAGKKAQNQLLDRISRADAEARAWEAGADSIVATASVSTPEQVRELVVTLGNLAKAATSLKNRLNKEVGKEE